MWSLSHWTTREIPFLIFDRQVLARFINHSSADTYEKYSVRFFLKDVFIYLFIFWLHWVFVAVHRLSLVAAMAATL